MEMYFVVLQIHTTHGGIPTIDVVAAFSQQKTEKISYIWLFYIFL